MTGNLAHLGGAVPEPGPKKKVSALALPVERAQGLLEIAEPPPEERRSWLRRLVSLSGGAKAGDWAGCLNCDGYWVVRIDGVIYRAHRIVFALYHGKDPGESQVDHADGDPSNNNPLNLRLATHGQNCQNSKINESKSRHPVTGEPLRKGLYYCKDRDRWIAQIYEGGKFVLRRSRVGPDGEAEMNALLDEWLPKLHGEFATDGLGGAA